MERAGVWQLELKLDRSEEHFEWSSEILLSRLTGSTNVDVFTTVFVASFAGVASLRWHVRSLAVLASATGSNNHLAPTTKEGWPF